MSIIKKLKMLAGAIALISAMGMATAANAVGKKVYGFSMDANIALNSQYILRGLTNSPEDNSAAFSAGVNFSKGDTGLYFGYWGSSLGYGNASGSDGIENDLFIGFKGKTGGFAFDIGLTTYAYANVSNSDTTELTVSVARGLFTAGVALNIGDDVAWSNEGDIYYYIGAKTDLPKGFKLTAKAGFYDYGSGTLGTAGSAFRHLDLTVSHALGKSGADLNVTLVIGGEDRDAVDQDNALIFGVSYSF